MVSSNRTDNADPARRRSDPGRSRVWVGRILTTVAGGLAGAYVGYLCGLMSLWLGPWDDRDIGEWVALVLGGPFLGAIAGAVAGMIGRVRLGATVGATTVVLFLVAICTVVDLDQVIGVGLVLLIAGSLAGVGGGALSKLMARSQLAQLTPMDALTILVGGLTGAFVGFCCSLVASSIDPRPVAEIFEAGGAFFGAIAGALGGAIRRAWLVAVLVPIAPVLFLFPIVLFTDPDLSQMAWWGGVLVIAAAVAGASGGVIRRRMAGNRRIQFSLTTVFYLVFAVAVACGLLAVKQQQNEWWGERMAAERRCEQLGVLTKLEHFQCFPDFGPWRRNMVGLRLVALASNEKGDPNDELIHLKEFPNRWLGRLTIEGKAFNDAGMAQLPGLRVNELALNGTQITDAGLVCLPRLKFYLQSLDLSDTRVTNAGLEDLIGLTNLRTLDLRNTHVTDSGVNKLQQALPKCRITH